MVIGLSTFSHVSHLTCPCYRLDAKGEYDEENTIIGGFGCMHVEPHMHVEGECGHMHVEGVHTVEESLCTIYTRNVHTVEESLCMIHTRCTHR